MRVIKKTVYGYCYKTKNNPTLTSHNVAPPNIAGQNISVSNVNVTFHKLFYTFTFMFFM